MLAEAAEEGVEESGADENDGDVEEEDAEGGGDGGAYEAAASFVIDCVFFIPAGSGGECAAVEL